MTGSIKSNVGVAQDAVSRYRNSRSVSSKTSTLGESNLSGMKTAMQVSNKIVGDLLKLQSSVEKQAEKFPKLASAIEQRDKQDANVLLNNTSGR
ncbi:MULTISPECIES: hypothetical protein [Lactococcus]|uniref:hypothetical protein n=1 Tax=Lactococcus TaxID=1357 RepID=UPI001923A830|nr:MULTISPECIES: hypothetical protein [Lactococcus]MBL3716867.1 hypothetical protein [Lactococcus garvieae]